MNPKDLEGRQVSLVFSLEKRFATEGALGGAGRFIEAATE